MPFRNKYGRMKKVPLVPTITSFVDLPCPD